MKKVKYFKFKKNINEASQDKTKELIDLLKGYNFDPKNNKRKIIKLVKTGVQINYKEPDDGNSALHLATSTDNLEIISLLLKFGADINSINNKMQTPLHYTIWHHIDNEQIIALLLNNGANPNAKDNWGMTPLHFTAQISNAKINVLLLEAGADIHASNRYGTKLPLYYAATNRNDDPTIVELFINKGANVHAKNVSGETVLEMVERVKPNNKKIINILKQAVKIPSLPFSKVQNPSVTEYSTSYDKSF